MDIERARKLKVGDSVNCPADRGSPAFTGRVSYIQPDAPAAKAFGSNQEYIWVNVTYNGRNAGVWPSNRLG